MDADLQPIYERVKAAVRPEDAFKDLTVVLPPRLLAEHLKSEMEQMLSVLDPAKYGSFDDKTSAADAQEQLNRLHAEALLKAKKGLYSLDDYTMRSLPSGGNRIAVDGVTYSTGEQIHAGEHVKVYKGRMQIDAGSAGVIFKLANTAEDNPHLFAEIRMLDLLHREESGYWRGMPFMFNRFMAGERVGIIQRYFDGLSLTAVRANSLHRNGLDQRHVVWVIDRMLGLLGYIHKFGIVHGRIEPDRIRVRPSNHNALLTGWGQAIYKPVKTGESIASAGGIFEAPEIRDGGGIGPWTDIYSLGKTLIWLIGGNPDTNEIPMTVEPVIQRFLRNMVRENPKGRPQDAWQLQDVNTRIKDSLWERRFIHLDLA